MFRLFYTPGWFNGYDLLFDCIALVIALLIAAYSFRVYRLNKENRFGYFSLAFVFVSISFALKVLTNSVLYSFPVRDTVASILVPAAGGIQYADIFYALAFVVQIAAMLGAWLLIFLISQKARDRLHKSYELMQIGLFAYLILLISVVSNFKYVVFYLTSTVLLGLIVLNYYKNYLNKDKNKNAFRVMMAFFFILLGNISTLFVFVKDWLYVLGEALVLVGFLLLLYTYRKIKR